MDLKPFISKKIEQGVLGVDTQALKSEGKLVYVHKEIFVKTEITGVSAGTDKPLFQISDDLKKGVKSFDGAKLEKGEPLFAGFAGLGWYQGAATHSGNNYQSFISDGADEIDPGLLNSSIRVTQNDKLLVSIPVESLLSNDRGALPRGNEDSLLKLLHPIFLQENQNFMFTLEVGEDVGIGGTAATDEIWLMFKLVGLTFGSR